MAHLLRNLKVPPNSVTMEEARHRSLEFFRLACRSIPSVIEIYNLHDIISAAELRSVVSAEIRKHSEINNPKVIDMLLFKGLEELKNYVEQSKQRHHIMGQYVIRCKENTHYQGNLHLFQNDENISNYLKNFYNTNYF